MSLVRKIMMQFGQDYKMYSFKTWTKGRPIHVHVTSHKLKFQEKELIKL